MHSYASSKAFRQFFFSTQELIRLKTYIFLMKKTFILLFTALATCSLASKQQSSRIDMENGVLGIADDRGFTLQSRDGRFIFKPYLFLQTKGTFNYYDNEGLDKAYNQDNVANSGFAMPYGIIGFTGRMFGNLDYNLSVNAAATGGNVLQQAWIDYRLTPAARFRAGKAKTPFTHAYLTTLGETLFPALPTSLTATSMPSAAQAAAWAVSGERTAG